MAEKGERVSNFEDLPNSCKLQILSFTSPSAVCRSSVLSKSFKSDSDSDIVWEKLLPPDYQQIISSSLSSSRLFLPSKKELYFSLCNNHILVDAGKKSFGLEKRSGKKSYMLGARDLLLVFGNTPRCWRWRAFPDSRFAKVAELVDLQWIKIQGNIGTRMLSPRTTYAAYLVIKFTEDAYGFDGTLALVSVKFVRNGGGGGGGCEQQRTVYMDPNCGRKQQLEVSHPIGLPRPTFGFPKERGDGWMEIEMGEFFNDEADGEWLMTLAEMKPGDRKIEYLKEDYWKAGLILQGIEVRPKESS